ncbi:Uncharacterised protein [Mycobacterium tuberculosis]|nr:Uncharacterised protein [Mycobacterium tuberculosis]
MAGVELPALSCEAILFTAAEGTVPLMRMVLCPLMVSRPSALGFWKFASTLARPLSGFRIVETS